MIYIYVIRSMRGQFLTFLEPDERLEGGTIPWRLEQQLLFVAVGLYVEWGKYVVENATRWKGQPEMNIRFKKMREIEHTT